MLALLLLLCSETGRARTAIVAGSPVLPLPVEFVAGGDGSPDFADPTLELGLGNSGSGRSGSEGGVPSIKLGYADEDCVRSCKLGLRLAFLPR